MKKLTLLLALTLLSCACGTGLLGSGNSSNQALATELTRVTEQVYAALHRGDRNALEEASTDDFTMHLSNGRTLNRSQLAAIPPRPSASTAVSDTAIINSSEDSAMMTYTETTASPGSPPGIGRPTARYVRRDGRWKMAVLHFNVPQRTP